MRWPQFAWAQPLGRAECPYAFRWVADFGFCAFRLHRWVGSDDPRAMHDHPYFFFTCVLWGGYDDVNPGGVEPMTPGTVRFRPARYTHTVRVRPGGCWTLLVSGPTVRRWGFWVGGKWRRAEKYFKKYGHHACQSVPE